MRPFFPGLASDASGPPAPSRQAPEQAQAAPPPDGVPSRQRDPTAWAHLRASALALALTLTLGWLALPAPGLTAVALPPLGSAFAAPPPRDADGSRESRLLAEMATQGTNTSRLYQLGDVCHDLGVTGDKKAVERAEAYLRQLLALEPTNAPALALLGSVYTMKGRDAFWPTQQLRLVHEGNAFMDQAVRLAPENHRVRVTRAFNNAHMPEFLGRTDTVRADLAWLLEKSGKQPDLFTVHERQEIALHWGRQLKRQRKIDDARKSWEDGQSLAPNSRLAGEIASELTKLR